jgi:hypothetical protein
MTIQEAIDATALHLLLHLRFPGGLNFLSRGYLTLLGSGEKGLQEGLFLFNSEIFVMASAFGRLVDGCRS